MKKSKKMLVTALSILALCGIGAGLLVGCDAKEKTNDSSEVIENYTLTWTIPDHAQVKVDDMDELPTSALEDTTIVFSITVDEGYAVDEVMANGRRVSLKNDKYSVTIVRDTEISIAVSESVSNLRVTSNPTKLTYIAGESVDITGLVVEATLGVGGTKTISYGTDGYSIYPTVFEGGETSFEITYKKLTVIVELDAVVEYSVKIDANGGQFTSSYLATLEAMNLHNYLHQNGVITFTYYNNLTSAVPMPKKNDVERENYTLTSWSYVGASISNATKANVDAKASWQIELVDIASVSLEKEGEVPYLIIEGTFKAATEVYLYLYEGNAKVELKGDTYTGSSNQQFEVKFDLRRLSDKGADYLGKWMDIRFNAKVGNIEESMEIYVNSSSTIQVDTSQKILAGDYSYIFAIYSDRLKVYFQTSTFTYELLCHAETNAGVTRDFLRITGHTKDSAHANKYVVISCWNDTTETEGYGANIDSSGYFIVEYPLQDFSSIIEKNIFFHITIYEDDTKAAIVYGGTDTNVKIADVFTSMPALSENLGDITHAFRYVGSDGLTYFIGYAWDGLMLYVMNEQQRVAVETAKVEEREGVIFYVVTGISTGYTSESLLYSFYFQHINNLDGLGEGDVYDDPTVSSHAIVDATGHFEMSCPVSTLIGPSFKSSSDTMWGLIAKYYLGSTDSERIEIKAPTVGDATITKDGVRYSIYANSETTWGIACLVLEKV